MASFDLSPVTRCRRRWQGQGFVRIELQVRKEHPGLEALRWPLTPCACSPGNVAATPTRMRSRTPPVDWRRLPSGRTGRFVGRQLPVGAISRRTCLSSRARPGPLGQRCGPGKRTWRPGRTSIDLPVGSAHDRVGSDGIQRPSYRLAKK